MQHLESSATPVLYIGRTVLKGLSFISLNSKALKSKVKRNVADDNFL